MSDVEDTHSENDGNDDVQHDPDDVQSQSILPSPDKQSAFSAPPILPSLYNIFLHCYFIVVFFIIFTLFGCSYFVCFTLFYYNLCI